MTKSRDLFKMTLGDLSQHLLALRYKDSLDILEKKALSKEQQVLISLCKSMLLGYGSTHSTHHIRRGLFNDFYNRAPFLDMELDNTSNSLFHNMLLNLQHQLVKQYGISEEEKTLFLPVNSIKTLKELFSINFNNFFEDTNGYVIHTQKKSIAMVKIKQADLMSIALLAIGTLGQFPNRDLQLWLAANEAEDFKQFFSKLYHVNQDVTLQDRVDNISSYYIPSEKSSFVIKKDILRMLDGDIQLINMHETSREEDEKPALLHKQIEKTSSKFFLMHHLRGIIQDIEIGEGKDTLLETQIQLSFSRLQYLLKNAIISNTPEQYLLFLEFAFDEIMFLNSLTQNKSRDELNKILNQFMQTQYLTKIDTFSCLSNSGMEAITQNLHAAIEEVKSFKENVTIYFSRDIYYQLTDHLKTLSDNMAVSIDVQDIPSECCLELSKDKSMILEYKKDGLCDIVVCDYFSAVSLLMNKHHETLVEELVENQLRLRRENGEKEDKNSVKNQLIVLIDSTMNNFDDTQVMLLIERFKKEITEGKLAVIVSQSLNKYFHIGYDKMSGGLSTGFYDEDAFPKLKKFHKQTIINYQINDPTIQMIATVLKSDHCADNIIAYYNKIKENSRYIHEKIIPKKLLRSEEKNQNIISLYDPSATLFQYCGFLVIKTEKKYIPYIQKMLIALDIEKRDGFGYAISTHCFIKAELMRVSIGIEEKPQLIAKFTILLRLICSINNLAVELNFDNDQLCRLINFLIKQYEEEYKTSKETNFELYSQSNSFEDLDNDLEPDEKKPSISLTIDTDQSESFISSTEQEVKESKLTIANPTVYLQGSLISPSQLKTFSFPTQETKENSLIAENDTLSEQENLDLTASPETSVFSEQQLTTNSPSSSTTLSEPESENNLVNSSFFSFAHHLSNTEKPEPEIKKTTNPFIKSKL